MDLLPRILPAVAAITALALPATAGAAAATPFAFDRATPGYASDLAIDPGGTAWLATPETVGNAGVVAVRIAARKPDGTVVAVKRVAAPSGRTFFEPRVAVAGGVATVAWTRQHNGGEFRVQAVRCTISGCGAVQTVGRAQRIKTRATPAVDSHGRSFVLWRGTSSEGVRLQWSISTRGHFGSTHTLGYAGDDIAAVAEPDGTFAAAWSSADGLRVTERRAGHEMSSPQRLATTHAAGTQLVTAGRELLAAWYAGMPDGEGQPGAGAVMVARRSAGGHGFHAAQQVFAGNGRSVALGANASGRAVAVFADAGANPGAVFATPVYAALREPGGAFGPPVLLDAESPLYAGTAAAVNAAGTATAAWTHASDGGMSAPRVVATAAPQGAGFAAPADLGSGQTPLAAAAAHALVVWNAGTSWLGVAF